MSLAVGAVVEDVVAAVLVGATVRGSEGLGDDGFDAVEAVDGCCATVAAGLGAAVEQADRATGPASTATTAG